MMDPIADAKMQMEDSIDDSKAPGMKFMEVVAEMAANPGKRFSRAAWFDGSEIFAGRNDRFSRAGSRPMFIAYTFHGKAVGLWQPCMDDFTAEDWRASE